MSSTKKRLMLICLSAALCTSAFTSLPVYAASAEVSADTVQTSTAAEKTEFFTIDDAIEYAKEHSSTLAALKAKEENAKYVESEARQTHDNMRKIAVSDINSYLVAGGYTYDAARFSYRAAQRNTIQGEYTLESKVSQAFYSYLSTVKKEQLAAESLASAHERVTSAELKYNNGTISANDFESFKIAELQAQNNLNTASRSKEYSMMQLKSAISYPLDQNLIVSGEFTRQPMDTTSPEDALAKAQTSISHVNAKESLELSASKLKRYLTFYSQRQPAWYSAKAEYAEAELTYNTALENEQLEIYNAYNNMLSLYETLDYLDKNLAYTQNQVDAAKARYELGMITSDDYISAVQQLDSLKNNISDTELNAYLASVQYRLTFDCENTIFEEEK